MGNPLQPVAQMPVPASTANTYTDLNGLAALKKDSKSPQAIHAIAQQVDALFLQMMLKSMRDASAGQGEADSNEMGMYQDMFDKQVALTLSQHQGLGIGTALTRQLSNAAAAAAPTGAPAAGAPATGAARGAPASGAAAGTPAAGASAAGGAAQPAPAPTSSAPPSTSMLQSASQFVSEVLPTIRRAADALGVSPLGMLAQAALETGWGQRMPRTADGTPSLNMFGIKADDGWAGARAVASTVEFSGGVATQRQTAFRAYGSIQESVSDFANLLKGSHRYRNAIAAGGNAQAYVNSIGQSGYATDPEYANKLNDILNGSTLRMALNVGSKKL
jgi:peptidoglycan hydrolase FlgJ